MRLFAIAIIIVSVWVIADTLKFFKKERSKYRDDVTKH